MPHKLPPPAAMVPGLILALTVWVGQAWAGAVYSFGIAPQQSASELAKRWAPILRHLSAKAGVTLQFTTSKDISSFQDQMRGGAYDFAFMNPHHYTEFRKTAGYTAFAHEEDNPLRGVIVVKNNGPITHPVQLQGLTVALPSPTAMAATWLTLRHLEEQGIKTKPQYVKSMDSIYLAVSRGLFPAGGGEMRTLGAQDAALRSQLRVLWASDPLPPHPFSAHPRVPSEVVAKVQKAMVEMGRTPEGRTLLQAINFKGIQTATDRDYDVVRRMKLTPPESS